MRLSKHIPTARRKKWWAKKWFRECIYNGPPIIFGIVMLYRIPAESTSSIRSWALAAIIWLIIASVLRVATAASDDKKEEPDVVHEGLYAAVATLHAVLSHYCQQVGCGGEMRATFHRVVPPLSNPTKIEQIIPYVGWNDPGTAREFSINTGITGHAIRSTTPTVMSSNSVNEQDHRRELVKEWGYTDIQARSLTSGRYSAAAIPVLDSSGHRTLGVIYLDSSEREIFDREDVRQILGVGSDAISDFVTKRYT